MRWADKHLDLPLPLQKALRGVQVSPGMEQSDVRGDLGLHGVEPVRLGGGRVQQPDSECNLEPVLRACGERGACRFKPDKQRGEFLRGEFLDGDTTANNKGLRGGQGGGDPSACVPRVQDDVLSDVRARAAPRA